MWNSEVLVRLWDLPQTFFRNSFVIVLHVRTLVRGRTRSARVPTLEAAILRHVERAARKLQIDAIAGGLVSHEVNVIIEHLRLGNVMLLTGSFHPHCDWLNLDQTRDQHLLQIFESLTTPAYTSLSINRCPAVVALSPLPWRPSGWRSI